jgi:hypothetical protein
MGEAGGGLYYPDSEVELCHREPDELGGHPSEPHVIYCRGCRRAWNEPSEFAPGCCACDCTDHADPLYEDWVVDPDPAEIPEGAWDD